MKKPKHLIINNPYRVPDRYWKYDRQRQFFDSTADTRPWFTSRPCEPTKKSHISHCVYDAHGKPARHIGWTVVTRTG